MARVPAVRKTYERSHRENIGGLDMSTMEMSFSPTTRHHEISIWISARAGTTRVQVGGRVVHGAESVGLLLEALARSVYRDTRKVTVDLGNVYKMDAAGLGTLAFAYAEARRATARLEIENAPRFIRDMLRITGLTELLNPSQGMRDEQCRLTAEMKSSQTRL